MITDIIPLSLLLLTGVVALILAIFLAQTYLKNRGVHHLLWAISFLVLFISGVLIILNDFDILSEPAVPVVAALIPAFLAAGLVYVVFDDQPFGLYFTFYAIIIIVLLAIVRLLEGFEDFQTPVLMAIHIPSGLVISFLPLYTAFISKETEITSAFFGIGGLLISFGGVLLAMAGKDQAELDQIFEVLPALLLIVGVLFFLGIIMPSKWKIDIPYISDLL
ncbi:MAG: hypothetical protein ACXABI_10050 [Candidatus Hodarchaeales archaeon]|jgi:hypothetical protein